MFVVWCKITCRKIKKSNDQQALDGPICSGESGKKVVSGGWYDCELVFYSGNRSQNDATWEKNNKTLVCCIKSAQELTIPDSWWGIMLNCMETHTEYPVLNASNTCFGQKVLFHYMGDKCHYYQTGAWPGWERVQRNKQPCLTQCGKKLQKQMCRSCRPVTEKETDKWWEYWLHDQPCELEHLPYSFCVTKGVSLWYIQTSAPCQTSTAKWLWLLQIPYRVNQLEDAIMESGSL